MPKMYHVNSSGADVFVERGEYTTKTEEYCTSHTFYVTEYYLNGEKVDEKNLYASKEAAYGAAIRIVSQRMEDQADYIMTVVGGWKDMQDNLKGLSAELSQFLDPDYRE